jgi:hypothetical protein
MQTITTIGLHIAKSVFQVHGIDAEGNVILRRQLKRRYVVASCASHHWSHEHRVAGSAAATGSGCSLPPCSTRKHSRMARRIF